MDSKLDLKILAARGFRSLLGEHQKRKTKYFQGVEGSFGTRWMIIMVYPKNLCSSYETPKKPLTTETLKAQRKT
jgi:hypothetical protein